MNTKIQTALKLLKDKGWKIPTVKQVMAFKENSDSTALQELFSTLNGQTCVNKKHIDRPCYTIPKSDQNNPKVIEELFKTLRKNNA